VRTLLQLRADVKRETKGQATHLQCQQGIQDALNTIDAIANWEFLLGSANISLKAPYGTGTVAYNGGSTSVTLSGGTLSTTYWDYPEVKFADRRLPYKVAAINTPTTFTTVDPISGTTNVTSGIYRLYQARYALPADCEPGRDLIIRGPIGQGINLAGKIKKVPRMSFEWKRYEIPTAAVIQYSSDDEFDSVNRRATIRFEPYPQYEGEFRLTYYKKLTVPKLDTDTVIIPEAFERIPILLAASQIMERMNLQGWMQKRSEAGELMQKMYNRYAVSPSYEGEIEPDLYNDDRDDFWAADNTMYTRT
jgi:hypothetical protein